MKPTSLLLVGMIGLIMAALFFIGCQASQPAPVIPNYDAQLNELQNQINDLKSDVKAANNTAVFAMILSIIMGIVLILLFFPKIKNIFSRQDKKSSSTPGMDFKYTPRKRKKKSKTTEPSSESQENSETASSEESEESEETKN